MAWQRGFLQWQKLPSRGRMHFPVAEAARGVAEAAMARQKHFLHGSNYHGVAETFFCVAAITMER